jgi:micrococcal nuclease
MRRVVVPGVAVLVFALLAIFAISRLLPGLPHAGSDTGPDTTSEGPTASSTTELPANATPSHVAFVYDGDTLYLQPDGTCSRKDEITVRLIGIDTPELRPEVECFGIEARDHLRALLPEGSAVWIAGDRGPLDRYDRSLLYLWTEDGDFVNLDLVENGYATAVRISPNEAHWPQLQAAESAARDAGRGLWGSC